MQEPWPAPSQGVAICAFADPSLLDELLRDYRDGATLKPGVARQISSRDWLVATNQVQHDATIDIARGFTSRNLKVSEIDLSHLETCLALAQESSEIRGLTGSMPTYRDSSDEENRKYSGY